MTWLFTNLEGSVDTQTVANTGVTERNYRDPYALLVCSGSKIPARGGTTLGSVLLVTGGEAALESVLDGEADDEATLAHESRHASQWAGYGNLSFALAYSGEMLFSQITTGDVACGNFFEHDAGMLEGGYSAYCGG